MPSFSKLFRSEHGGAAIEYGLLAALIAATIIVGITALGSELDGALSRFGSAMDAATGSGSGKGNNGAGKGNGGPNGNGPGG